MSRAADSPRLKAAVIGYPVAQSRSPLIHNHWLQKHQINGIYEKRAVTPEDFDREVRELMARGYGGVNVTVPHKQAAFALADKADAIATRLQAANMLTFKHGKIHARNTDGAGFMASLKAGVRGIFSYKDSRPQSALVLGAGGASRAIIAALAKAGVKNIYVANRTLDKIPALLPLVAQTDCKLHALAWENRSDVIGDVGSVVNTTSLGMKSGSNQSPLEMDFTNLSRETVVADIVYAPLETAFLRAARARGCVGVDGLGMLLHQAVPAFAAWFDKRPWVTKELRKIVEDDLLSDGSKKEQN